MDKNFYNMALKTHQDRIKAEKNHSLVKEATTQYSLFCVWCRAYKNANFTIENFREYQKKANLNFWIRKKIAELFFGYKFEFDYETKKWIGTKC